MKLIYKKPATLGFLLVLVLVFGSIFFLIIGSFFGYVATQGNVISQKVELQRALDIAEAGLGYYRWRLAHYPDDVTDGTGLPGPYVHTYSDPEGGAIGEFSLEISSTTFCGEVSSILVSSTGYTYEDPNVQRTITARYARPTVAEYAYIINSSVWAGEDRVIVGPYHTNGGVRMDGRNFSTVSSGQTTWSCTNTFGCSPTGNRDGVFTTTANANTALFNYPSAPIDFAGITVDLSQMQSKAQTGGGHYIGPSGNYGYKIRFNSAGTFTVERVTNTYAYTSYTSEGGYATERHVITGTSTVGTYAINSDCPLIFVEDKVWLEGNVNQKVTIAAADVDSSSSNPQIIINNDISYTSTSSGLLAVAEQDVLIGLNVPNNMTINGIFVAKNGRFGRNHYYTAYLNSTYDPYVFRSSLTVNGTIVSNGREGTKWSSGGVQTSGFTNRVNTYDRNLVLNPPPLAPNTSDLYVVTEWKDNR